MTKRQMEERIEALEKELNELKSQLISLALRPAPSYPVYIPALPLLPEPVYAQPQIQPNWDPAHWPTITCNSGFQYQ